MTPTTNAHVIRSRTSGRFARETPVGSTAATAARAADDHATAVPKLRNRSFAVAHPVPVHSLLGNATAPPAEGPSRDRPAAAQRSSCRKQQSQIQNRRLPEMSRMPPLLPRLPPSLPEDPLRSRPIGSASATWSRMSWSRPCVGERNQPSLQGLTVAGESTVEVASCRSRRQSLPG